MSQQRLKMEVAEAALEYVSEDCILGIGSGSTVNCFIDALGRSRKRIEGAVAASEESARRLKELNIPLLELNNTGGVDIYIDGADEVDPHRRLIKGGGGALTREKIIVAASRRFVCIVDESKRVGVLGAFPLPVEVIPMARSLVARKLVGLGGQPEWREGFITDNGNVILDVHNLDLVDPVAMEQTLNNLPGVVTNGLFALRGADQVLVASESGITKI